MLNKWPGLASETALICQNLGIEDVNLTNKDKSTYMKLFLEASHQKNEEKLRSLVTGKCERISQETYQKRDFILLKNPAYGRQSIS